MARRAGKTGSGHGFYGIHEGFVSEVHARHVLLDELINARDFLVQGGFNFIVVEDLPIKVIDFEDSHLAIFVVAFGGVGVTGDFFAFPGGGCAGGVVVRVIGGTFGDVAVDLIEVELTLDLGTFS